MSALHFPLMNNFSRLGRIIAVVLALILVFAWMNGKKVQAQDTQSEWSVPVNVSNSGSAQKPALIADSNNKPLALWKDSFSGFQYSIISDSGWSDPKEFPVPFVPLSVRLRYQFLNGRTGNVYVFWIDDAKQLFYSTMSLISVDNLGAWKPARLLSKNTENYSVTMDEDEGIHVAYLIGRDTAISSAGIYYTKITQDNAILPPVAMDQSSYFRKLIDIPGETGEPDPSLATLAVGSYGSGSTNTVFLSWNNPTTKRLFFRRSTNGGLDWDEVLEIVTPDERSANQVPQKPSFALVGNTNLLLWQYSQEEISCVQYYQSSTDQGVTWDERRELLGDINGCPEQNKIFTGADKKVFLVSILNNQVYLTILKNNEIDSPQLQNELTSFSDPTTFSIIRLQSQQMLLVGNQLYYVGSGIGETGDIWISSRSIDSFFDPSNTKAVWSNPNTITKGQDSFRNILLLTNQSSLVHAFWSQSAGGSKNDPGAAIYYAGWLEPGELNPRPILRSPEGKSDQPSAVVDENGRMSVVWSGGKSGELFFSYADNKQASTQLDWSEPNALSLSSTAVNPILRVGLDGTSYIAYLTPVNEQRGVYVTSSQDRGETWSKPVQVFDAAAQNCEMVEHLSYIVSDAGTQHLAWMCSTIPGGAGAYALNYARSSDRGQTWSVKRDENEKKLIWGEVAGLRQDNIHLVWLEDSGGVYRLGDQVSKDDGETWQSVEEIDTFEEQAGPSALVVDPGGQLFLLVTMQETGKVILNSWNWNGESWTSVENKKLVSGQISLVSSLAAIVLPRGELGVLYSLENTSPGTGLTNNSLIYLFHPVKINVPVSIAEPRPVTPTEDLANSALPGSVTPASAEITASPQPTVDLNALKETGNPRTSSILIYLVGAILALVVVIIAVIISQTKHLNK